MKHVPPSSCTSAIPLSMGANSHGVAFSRPDALGLDSQGNDLVLDIAGFIGNHTLIQAVAGGGKSFALRKILEIVHGASVPFLVFDPEDEFSTLKEACPNLVIIGGEDADLALDIYTIPEVMLTLLETRASAVIQLHDLTLQEQRRIVAASVGTLMQAPKSLWRPLAIAIDETQRFAPENENCESTGPLADLMRQGRKRHFSGIMATQRFTQVSKSCTSQARNVLVGLVTNSTDIQRARLELGLDKAEAESLRYFKRGNFLAHGPALAHEPIQVCIAKPRSPHGCTEPLLTLLERPRLPIEEIIEQLRATTGPDNPGAISSRTMSLLQTASQGRRFSGAVDVRPSGQWQELGLSESAGAMLVVLATAPNSRLSIDVLGLLVQLPPSGKVFTRILGELLADGYAALIKAGVRLTPAGMALSEDYPPSSPTLTEMAASIRMNLQPNARRLLDTLVAASPGSVSADDLALRSGSQPSARKLKGHLKDLIRLRLVRKVGDRYAATAAISTLLLR